MTKYQLPDLPYSYDAFEPYLDAETMKIHHSKHHAAYVEKLNAVLEKHPELFSLTVEDLLTNLEKIPEDIKEGIQNNGGGHANHSFFWQIMKPKGNEPKGKIVEAIQKKFGNVDNFKKEFSNAAITRFGSGWAWLSVTSLGELEVRSTSNQDSPLSEGLIPILTLDIWEHAYYLKYQNRRQEYIQNWWHVVNWEKVEENYVRAIDNVKSNL